MSQMGQSRRPDGASDTSGLPQSTDLVGPARLVRFVPKAEVECRDLILTGGLRRPPVFVSYCA